MEIQKVIRILTLFIAFACFAIHVASRLMFPEACASDMPILVTLLLAVCAIWNAALRTKKQNKNSNE